MTPNKILRSVLHIVIPSWLFRKRVHPRVALVYLQNYHITSLARQEKGYRTAL